MENFDKNMIIATELGKEDILFYSVKEAPFKLYGLFDKELGKRMSRMDIPTAKKVSDGVAWGAYATAGAKVRFKTDSDYIAVSLKLDGELGDWPQMSGVAAYGCDLYEICNGEYIFKSSFIPPLHKFGTYEQIIELKNEEKLLREYVINLPIYGQVDEMYIGINKDALLKEGEDFFNTVPVYFYGSSITQGGCMSRPGMCYVNILSRKYNMNIHNLGFAGNAKGETEMAKYISGLKMSMFVYDYDYNSPSPDHLLKTHRPMFEIIRKKNPCLPIIIMSGVSGGDYKERIVRRDIIKKTYDNAVAAGDKNVYFIDGSEIFKKYGFSWNEPTVEGCHPTDLGFALMAAAVSEVIDENNLLNQIKG